MHSCRFTKGYLKGSLSSSLNIKCFSGEGLGREEEKGLTFRMLCVLEENLAFKNFSNDCLRMIHIHV